MDFSGLIHTANVSEDFCFFNLFDYEACVCVCMQLCVCVRARKTSFELRLYQKMLVQPTLLLNTESPRGTQLSQLSCGSSL